MENDTTVDINYGHIRIMWYCEEDQAEYELLYWDRDEWVQDPDVVFAIANAILLAKEEGAEAVASRIGRTLEECKGLDSPSSKRGF